MALQVGIARQGEITRRSAVALGAAFAALGGHASHAAETGPALWAAQSKDATVYLFGQTPLPAGVDWMRPAIDAAFEASDTLWVENPDRDPDAPPPHPEPTVAPDYTIMDDLGPADRNRLTALFSAADAPLDALKGQDPATVYQILAVLVDQQTGADYAAMPEAKLKARARAEGKAVRSEWGDLRSIAAFSRETPKATHVQTVRMKLDEADRIPQFAADVAAWLAGDIGPWDKTAARMAKRYPEAYQRIGASRNAAWAAQIQTMSGWPGARFVCVGIGHLAGPDSIPAQLASAGMKVRRV